MVVWSQFMSHKYLTQMVHHQYDETLVQETVQNPYQTPENARIYFL